MKFPDGDRHGAGATIDSLRLLTTRPLRGNSFTTRSERQIERKDFSMKIKQIICQNRRDFQAIYECQGCGYEYKDCGYDDE
jgi:hypothetical protein